MLAKFVHGHGRKCLDSTVMLFNLKTQPFLDEYYKFLFHKHFTAFLATYITITTTSTLTQHYPFRHKLPI